MTTRYDVSDVPLQGGYIAKQCPVVAQNRVVVPVEPAPVEPFQQRLYDNGTSYEADVVEKLKNLHPSLVVITGGGEGAEAATVDAMKRDVPVILNARFADECGRRIGKPDVLIAAANGGYHAVDIKWHMTLEAAGLRNRRKQAVISTLQAPRRHDATDDSAHVLRRHEEDVLQLAHYQRILEALGFAAPEDRWGGIIGTEAVVVWHDLDQPLYRTPSVSSPTGTTLRTAMERYDFEFNFRLDIIAAARLHQTNPSAQQLLVLPVFKRSECSACDWRDYCVPALEEAQDISLLPRIGWAQWKLHRDAGVTNIPELAALNADRDGERFAAFKRDALQEQIDQARAYLGAGAYRRRGIETVTVPRADVEVDIDMENTETGVYLWGAFVSPGTEIGREAFSGAQPSSERPDGTRSSSHLRDGYQAFGALHKPLDAEYETRNSLQFWSWLQELRQDARKAGLSFKAYCWNAPAENQFLRKLGIASGIEEEIEDFIESDEWVDLLRLWDTQMITGRSSSLKAVAPLCGFHWDVDDPGGADSMVKYDESVAGSEESRRWLLNYNEGDVKATKAIRQWMIATVLAGVADLEPGR